MGLIQTDVFIQGSAASQLDMLVRSRESSGTKAYVQGLNLNAGAPIDLATITVPATRYIPVSCFVYDPTANLAAANLGLYTAAAAGGVAIVAPVALASLTGVGKIQQLTIAALTDLVTAPVLFPRLTVASGVAGTASLVIEFVDLTLI